jgi:hypothetical protein
LTHNDKRTWSCPDGPSKNVKKEHVILTWNSVKYVNVLKKCDDVTNQCLLPMWDFTNNINDETGDVAFNQKKRGSLSFQPNVWDLVHYIYWKLLSIKQYQTMTMPTWNSILQFPGGKMWRISKRSVPGIQIPQTAIWMLMMLDDDMLRSISWTETVETGRISHRRHGSQSDLTSGPQRHEKYGSLRSLGTWCKTSKVGRSWEHLIYFKKLIHFDNSGFFEVTWPCITTSSGHPQMWQAEVEGSWVGWTHEKGMNCRSQW